MLLLEILWATNVLGAVLFSYGLDAILLMPGILSFICKIDKLESKHKKHRKHLHFKHRMFFIVQESMNKREIALKTFVLEIIWYIILAIICFLGIYSVFLEAKLAIYLLIVPFSLIVVFGIVTGTMEDYARKKYGKEE